MGLCVGGGLTALTVTGVVAYDQLSLIGKPPICDSDAIVFHDGSYQALVVNTGEDHVVCLKYDSNDPECQTSEGYPVPGEDFSPAICGPEGSIPQSRLVSDWVEQCSRFPDKIDQVHCFFIAPSKGISC